MVEIQSQQTIDFVSCATLCLKMGHLDTHLFNFNVHSVAFILALAHQIFFQDGVSLALVGLFLTMSLTHFILYPFIWFRPKSWASLTGGGDPSAAVHAFGVAVAIHKALILLAFIVSGWLDSGISSSLFPIIIFIFITNETCVASNDCQVHLNSLCHGACSRTGDIWFMASGPCVCPYWR